MKNIAVFFGGESVEHDVSVITGVLTLNSLDKSKYSPVPVYVDKCGVWRTGEELFDVENFKSLDVNKLIKVTFTGGSPILFKVIKDKKLKPLCTISCAVNCMHGERGEDGALAGILSMCKIPLCSPDITSSAVCIDKRITKAVLKGLSVKTLNCIAVKSVNDIRCEKFPVVVKPNRLGSSIGVSVAENEVQLRAAVSLALRYGEQAIVEEKLVGFTEINCAAYMDGKGNVITSPCEKPSGKTDLLTFDDKYSGGQREFPANIPEQLSRKIKSITEKVYLFLGASGIIRIDFFVKDKSVYVNEINTVPGSLAYYLFCDTLKEFGKLLADLIAAAEMRYSKQTTFIKTFDSGVLNISGAKGAKRL